MTGTIVRALNWDVGYEQRFLAVNPLGDEVTVYQTHHDDPGVESNALVKVHSHHGIDHIQCISYLRSHVGWTGVGTMDGVVHVFDVTHSGSSLKLRVKHARPCNAVTFNTGTLVAAAFDKSRQDGSLQVWDVARGARLFERDEVRPHLGFLANEATLSTVFNDADPSGMLLMAGGYKLLREFDLRDSQQPVYQVATKCTSSITPDPFQLHQFASVAEDGSVAIWDRRKLTGGARGAVVLAAPALFFLKLVAELRRACLRYLSVRRGEFSAVFNGNLIRRWNTGCVPRSDRTHVPTISGTTASWKQQAAELYGPGDDQLFVALVLDVSTDWPRVVSFDYSPDTSLATSTNFVCMREKGLVFRMPVVESIEALNFNLYNEFTMAGPEGTSTCFDLEKFPDAYDKSPTAYNEYPDPADKLEKHNYEYEYDYSKGHEESKDLESHLEYHLEYLERTKDTEREREREREKEQLTKKLLKPNYALAKDDKNDACSVMHNDICAVMRRRAVAGYCADAAHNVSLLPESSELRGTWQWLALAKKALDKGTMVRDGVDLGFVGVLAMWRGADELAGQQRGQVSDDKFGNAVRQIIADKERWGIVVYDDGDRRLQRRLCLAVSGWYLTTTELEEKLAQLASAGHVERAAAWAVFHGDVARAADILANSGSERLRLMAAAVSGHLNSDDLWRAQCRRLAADLDSAYLRAIFAYVADRDWWDVLDEQALPLRERIGIAVRFLPDRDLNVYLARVAEQVVARGELEGLIMTGLTPRGIDLLQLYVDRTGDVQTAALMAQAAVPRYFVDERVSHWIDCYRSLLDLWTLFRTRAHFDVARTKLARTSTGTLVMRPPPRQVYLQCGRCNKSMSGSRSRVPAQLKQFLRLLLKTGANGDGCPQCGAPLPRCAICLLTLDATILSDEVDKVHRAFNSKMSFCLSCNHGYHAHHAEEWFSKHYVCPVPDCNCRCNSK